MSEKLVNDAAPKSQEDQTVYLEAKDHFRRMEESDNKIECHKRGIKFEKDCIKQHTKCLLDLRKEKYTLKKNTARQTGFEVIFAEKEEK